MLCFLLSSCNNDNEIKADMLLGELDKIYQEDYIHFNLMADVGTINTEDSWYAYIIGSMPVVHPTASFVEKKVDKVKKYKKHTVTDNDFEKLKKI